MKKLSVLIALALCLTIGGAYAGWTYVTGLATPAAGTPFGITMGDVTLDNSGSVGQLSASFTSAITVEPDDGETTVTPEIDYTPVLAANGSSDLVVKFVPAETASKTVKTNGVAVTVTLEITTAYGSFNGSDVLTLAANPKFVVEAGTGAGNTTDGKWKAETDGSFTYTITANEIISKIVLNTSKDLLTIEDYNAYKTAIEAGQITINVNGNVVTP